MATKLAITEHLNRLGMLYKAPDDVKGLVDLWHAVLEDVTDIELKQAVRAYMRSDRSFFPKPGQLLRFVEGERQQHYGDRRGEDGPKDWNQTQEGPCPVCGAVMQLATDPLAAVSVWDAKEGRMRKRREGDPPPVRRYQVVHDYDAHMRAREPIVGQSTRRPYGKVRGSNRDPHHAQLPDGEAAGPEERQLDPGGSVHPGAAGAGGQGLDGEARGEGGREEARDLPF